MANVPDVYWSVDGTSLQTLAYNIETWGGDREAPPALRGANNVVPGRVGAIWTAKVPDSRIITLSMWVVGADSDGNVPVSGTAREVFEANWHMLRKLLWNPNREITLTKQFRLFGSSTIITAAAKAQFTGGLNPTMNGRTRAVFTVDLLLSDPFFYGDQVVTTFTSATRTQNLTILGDYRTNTVEMEILNTSVVNSPKITNVTQGNIFMGYTGSIPNGDALLVKSKEFNALYTPSTGNPYYVSGNVTHTASELNWLYLEPGVQQLTVSVTSGTGPVNLKHRPVWL